MTASINMQCRPTTWMWSASVPWVPPESEGVFGEDGEQMLGEDGEAIQGE